MPIIRAGLCHILSEDVVDKLRNAQIKTVADYLQQNAEAIVKKCQLPYQDVVALRRILLAEYAAYPINGLDVYEDSLKTTAILSTGCNGFDGLLDGGLYTGEITEVFGRSATGKTQFCLLSCLYTAQVSKQNSVYLSTNGSFSPQRLLSVLKRKNTSDMDSVDALSRIRCIEVFDVFEVLDSLELIQNTKHSQSDPFFTAVKVLVIDCIASVISPILGGKQLDGHGYMMQVAQMLKHISTELNMAVLVTNNCLHSDYEPDRPSLGKAWSHIPHNRLQLKSSSKEPGSLDIHPSRQALLTKSIRQKQNASCVFNINDKGFG